MQAESQVTVFFDEIKLMLFPLSYSVDYYAVGVMAFELMFNKVNNFNLEKKHKND